MVYRRTEKMRKRTAKRRQQLVTAARRLFAEQGYSKTSMNDIVTQAGTSIGNCYFYFENKAALLQAVIDEINREIAESVDQKMQKTTDTRIKLALAIYSGLEAVLEGTHSAGRILTDTGHLDIRRGIIDYFTSRIERFLRHSPHVSQSVNCTLAANAWQGTAFHLMEKALAGEIEEDSTVVGLFLVEWNLRAIGLPNGEIQAAIKGLRSLYPDLPSPSSHNQP